MSPQQAAHLRMLSTLPVRTHEMPQRGNLTGSLPQGRTKKQAEALRDRILDLKKKGMTNRAVADALRISRQTVFNYTRNR